MRYLLPFSDPRALTVEAAGGKGANLAFMTQHGLPVPGGCVVGADAYRDFVRNQDWLSGAADALPVEDPAGRAGPHRLTDLERDRGASGCEGRADDRLNRQRCCQLAAPSRGGRRIRVSCARR